jgi:hypothetical protein
VALVAPIAAAFAVLAIVGWLVGSALGRVPGGDKQGTPIASGPSATTSAGQTSAPPRTQAALQAATVRGASLYDPSPSGDGAEAKKIDQSYDGDPATAWPTDLYKRSATFGNLKKGLGIAYDLGEPTALKQVQITTSQPGSDVQILAGDSANAGDPASYRVVGSATGLGITQTIQLHPDAPAQFYIVWITKLVPAEGGQFGASLSEVRFLK